MRLLAAASALSFVGLLVCSCGGGNAASKLVQPPDYQPKDQTKCGVAKSQAKPLIVEWPSPDRLELENKVHQGLVVVHYVGCEMSVLDRCSVAAKYTYQGATRNQDKVEMKDEDDLYAHLPVGAAGLEATLQRTGRLTVDMNLVGRFEADRASVRADELQGDCAGATHFVYGVTVGAFDFYAGGQANVGASAGVGNFGAGAHSQAERESLTKAGDESACSKATTGDKSPPEGCGALIRLEVVPLGEATSAGCTQGLKLDGTKCAPDVDTSCAAGMHAEAGKGCAADVAPQTACPQAGFVRDPKGTCVAPSCGPGGREFSERDGRCECPDPQVDDKFGRCSCPGKTTPTSTYADGSIAACACPHGEPIVGGECICSGSQYRKSGDGGCNCALGYDLARAGDPRIPPKCRPIECGPYPNHDREPCAIARLGAAQGDECKCSGREDGVVRFKGGL